VQLAVARGATVIGTAGQRNHDFLRSLGAEGRLHIPVAAEFPLAEAAAAHTLSETRHARGRIVLVD
jgi:NADPH:quinone reductase-like Zn-dependent oxidoreductase